MTNNARIQYRIPNFKSDLVILNVEYPSPLLQVTTIRGGVASPKILSALVVLQGGSEFNEGATPQRSFEV
jgi:hypothetical protein